MPAGLGDGHPLLWVEAQGRTEELHGTGVGLNAAAYRSIRCEEAQAACDHSFEWRLSPSESSAFGNTSCKLCASVAERPAATRAWHGAAQLLEAEN